MDVPPLRGTHGRGPHSKPNSTGARARRDLHLLSSLPGQTRGKEGPWTLDPRPTGSATIALQRSNHPGSRLSPCSAANQQRAAQLMTRLLLHPVSAPDVGRMPALAGHPKERTVNALQRIAAAVGFALLVSSGSSVFAANAVIVGGAEIPHQDHRRERRQFQGSHHLVAAVKAAGRHPQRRRALHCFRAHQCGLRKIACRHCRYAGEAGTRHS